MPSPTPRRPHQAFTLIELLTVVAIISLLISIMMPSLTRARDQAKSVHCLAKLKEYGNALASYENIYSDQLPPAHWYRENPEEPGTALARYGWAELLYVFVYKEEVKEEKDFPVLRNVRPEQFGEYLLCRASSERGVNSGHYRVYLPGWAAGSYSILEDGTFGLDTRPDPWASTMRTTVPPRLPLIGDANEYSWAGEPCASEEAITSYIDAGEANDAGTTGRNGNRFSDRHYGGANYLFADFHASWEPKLREKLAVDWDLNGVDDVEVVP